MSRKQLVSFKTRNINSNRLYTDIQKRVFECAKQIDVRNTHHRIEYLYGYTEDLITTAMDALIDDNQITHYDVEIAPVVVDKITIGLDIDVKYKQRNCFNISQMVLVIRVAL